MDLNELEQGPNRVFNPRIGHVGDSHRLPVEYESDASFIGL